MVELRYSDRGPITLDLSNMSQGDAVPFRVLLDAPNRSNPVTVDNQTFIQIQRDFNNKLYRRVMAEFNIAEKQSLYNQFFERNYFDIIHASTGMSLIEDTFDGHATGELIATDPYNPAAVLENEWRYISSLPQFRLSYCAELKYPDTVNGSSCAARRAAQNSLASNIPVNTEPAFVFDCWLYFTEISTSQRFYFDASSSMNIESVPPTEIIANDIQIGNGKLYVGGFEILSGIVSTGWNHIAIGVDQVAKRVEIYVDEIMIYDYAVIGTSGVVRTFYFGMYGAGYKTAVDYVHYGPEAEIVPYVSKYFPGSGSILDLIQGGKIDVFKLWDMSSDELVITDNIGAGAGTINIRDINFRAGLRGFDRIYILTADRLVGRKILNATEAGGKETLTLDSTIGTAIPVGSIIRAGIARLCRINAESISFDFITSDVYTVNLPLRECKANEYEALT